MSPLNGFLNSLFTCPDNNSPYLSAYHKIAGEMQATFIIPDKQVRIDLRLQLRFSGTVHECLRRKAIFSFRTHRNLTPLPAFDLPSESSRKQSFFQLSFQNP